jgi:ABC-type glycerol-3-phosphate transport system permease component
MMAGQGRIPRVLAHFVLIAFAVVILLPVWWIVITALEPSTAIFDPHLRLWPQYFQWHNFVQAFTSQPFALFFANSLGTNVAIVLIQVITSSLAAYGFAFVPFRGSKPLFFVTLLGMMIPLQATFIPVYLMLSQVHLIDTYASLVLPFVGSAFGVFLMRQAFLSIPKELIAAAHIDGASHLRILWSIVLPNAKPALITLTLLNFVFHYNSLFWPLVATNSVNVRVLPVALSYFLSNEGGANLQWNLMMAADLFTIVPVFAIFLFGQRFIVRGITSFGVKG